MSLRSRVSRIVKRHKGLEPAARGVDYLLWRCLFYSNRLRGSAKIKYIYINPSSIRYAVVDPFEHFRRDKIGSVLPGDWDRMIYDLDHMDVIEAVQSRISNVRGWNETSFYERVIHEINAGEEKFGCGSQSQFDSRLQVLDDLMLQIRSEGYKSQKELGSQRPWDEVAISIGRNGELLFAHGRHRFAIARSLEIKSIPAVVYVRHEEWRNFSEAFRAFMTRAGGKSYQPILHPDLSDIGAKHDDTRLDIIKQNLPIQQGRLLDIGAHLGYFCENFEELGFTCVGVEISQEHANFMRKLRDANKKNYEVVEGSIFDVNLEEQFDIVLALNVFHHFLRNRQDYFKLQAFLGRLNAKFMVFESHLPGSAQMRGAYRDYAPDEFVDFILEHSKFSESKPIGIAEDGRPMYLLK